MNDQTKKYQALAVLVAAALGVVAGIAGARFGFKLSKPRKGG
jgi:hypothetical protein